MQKHSQNPTAMGNRDKILQTAIDLFSQKGFSAVTMHEISAAVGIRAASIYNHFSSKDAILQQIVTLLRDALHVRVHPAFDLAAAKDIRAFIADTEAANLALFREPLYARIGSIVMQEQFQHESVRTMLLEEMIEAPRAMIAAYFAHLMQTGRMRKADPVVAAKEYHAFYIYGFYEAALSYRLRTPDPREQYERELHEQLFLRAWAPEAASSVQE